MAQYTTALDSMALGATRVDDASGQIQAQLNSLRCEVEVMMSGWRGEAAASFVRVHEAFEHQVNTINNALRRMHEALLATQHTYGSQEANQTQLLSGLAGRING